MSDRSSAATPKGQTKRLGEMTPGERGRIVRVEGSDRDLLGRILEIGLLEGSRVEVVREAPFGGDPLAVRVRGALIAIRRNEGNLIEVEVEIGESS